MAEEYNAYSARASENIRALSLSALAIVWVFADQSLGGLQGGLLWVCLMIVVVFLFDFIQYVFGAGVFGYYLKKAEEGDLAEVSISGWARAPIKVAYHLKTGVLFLAYVLLAVVVFGRVGKPVTPSPSGRDSVSSIPNLVVGYASDAGASVPDAGASVPDAGASVPDAGASVPDAGASVPDVSAEAQNVARPLGADRR